MTLLQFWGLVFAEVRNSSCKSVRFYYAENSLGQKVLPGRKVMASQLGRTSAAFKYPLDLRRLIYTTNMIDSYHRQLRKVTKGKAIFPNDDALAKMLYLVTMEVTRCALQYKSTEFGNENYRVGKGEKKEPTASVLNNTLLRSETQEVEEGMLTVAKEQL